MSGENPYAAPQSAALPDAPESFGWELVEDRVWAEKFAQFPMVDPYSGESDEVMTMNRLTVRQRPIWIIAIRWICIGLIFQPITRLMDGDLSDGMTLLGFAGFFISIIATMFFPICGLKVFFTGKTLRKHTIQLWTINGFFVIGILTGITAGNSGLLPSRFPPTWISSVAFGLWFLGLIWKNLIQHRLSCRRQKDGRFEIRGFHPRALVFLAQEKNAPQMLKSEAATVSHSH